MAEPADASADEVGEVLFCGGTDWALLGRGGGSKKKTEAEKQAEVERGHKYPNLNTPHRLKSLQDVRITFVAAGSAASHCIVGDVDGRCFTWGRNEKGQLGHGDTLQRSVPTFIEKLKGKHVIGGAGGKHHTALATQDGASYTFGSNLNGQCGTGSIKSAPKAEELVLNPRSVNVEGCSAVACGAEFTMWLCKGQLYSAGLPQYGQLGHGTDGEYNAKDSSVKLMYAPQPKPTAIKALAELTITKVACGHNHTVALDDKGGVYSWGNGGYGRLGHEVQQDEFKPRQIQKMTGRTAADPKSIVACGSTSSFANMTGGTLVCWGKLKVSGDNTMYPKPIFHDLQGWGIRHMACGNATFAVAAEYQEPHRQNAAVEHSTITWGNALYGELGYGSSGKKSSANPDKCMALEGCTTLQVAAGMGQLLFLVKPDDKTKALPVFEPEVLEEESKQAEAIVNGAAAPAKGAGKGKGAKGAGAAKRKADTEPAKGKGKSKKS
ncbi:hypothetical protein WJX73_004262 [Symbiochloris irregularis]|uniref:RCC1-like domain-containing protein n=1 Tax=Symbiochloris irregularis TaxID=706552 RepID=A0AAW1P6F9_9CHLO